MRQAVEWSFESSTTLCRLNRSEKSSLLAWMSLRGGVAVASSTRRLRPGARNDMLIVFDSRHLSSDHEAQIPHNIAASVGKRQAG